MLADCIRGYVPRDCGAEAREAAFLAEVQRVCGPFGPGSRSLPVRPAFLGALSPVSDRVRGVLIGIEEEGSSSCSPLYRGRGGCFSHVPHDLQLSLHTGTVRPSVRLQGVIFGVPAFLSNCHVTWRLCPQTQQASGGVSQGRVGPAQVSLKRLPFAFQLGRYPHQRPVWLGLTLAHTCCPSLG